mgnify:CR=1 FL=1
MIQDIAIHRLISKVSEYVDGDASIKVDTEKKALLVDAHLEIALPDFVIDIVKYFDD